MSSSDSDTLVVNKDEDEKASFLTSIVDVKKNGTVIIIIVLIVIVISVAYCKNSDGFVSPDGVVARRSQRQSRSDTEIDRTWNMKELERSVALLNKKAKTK